MLLIRSRSVSVACIGMRLDVVLELSCDTNIFMLHTRSYTLGSLVQYGLDARGSQDRTELAFTQRGKYFRGSSTDERNTQTVLFFYIILLYYLCSFFIDRGVLRPCYIRLCGVIYVSCYDVRSITPYSCKG